MGFTLRATTLIVATALVTLSSAANAHYRHGAARGDDQYVRQIRWCSGLRFLACPTFTRAAVVATTTDTDEYD
jgi:hypothetical protein